MALNLLMVYSSLHWGQTVRQWLEGKTHVREGISHYLQKFCLVDGVKTGFHIQLDKV